MQNDKIDTSILHLDTFLCENIIFRFSPLNPFSDEINNNTTQIFFTKTFNVKFENQRNRKYI